MKRLRPFLFLCLLFPCLLGGCGITPDIPFQNGGTTCGNITMGRGGSAYSNGFIYTFPFPGVSMSMTWNQIRPFSWLHPIILLDAKASMLQINISITGSAACNA